MESDTPIRSLILVGGKSTRMGFPKHLLRTSLDIDSQSLLYCIAEAHRGLPRYTDLTRYLSSPITISVRDQTQQKQVLNYMAGMCFLHDASIVIDTEVDVGPSAGLLSAHRLDPSAHWVVTGCDYPSITTEALRQLAIRHVASKPAVTCFLNESGFTEPLLAIWSPASLTMLENALLTDQRAGPNGVIRKLTQDSEAGRDGRPPYERGVEILIPEQGKWIEDVNTIQDWQRLQQS